MSDARSRRPGRAAGPDRPGRRWGLLAGMVLVTAVVLLLAQVAQLAVTGLQTRRVQATLLSRLAEPAAAPVTPTAPAGSADRAPAVTAADPAPAASATPSVPVAGGVPTGEPLAVVEIPRFGEDWRWAVLEGTADEVIADGIGHYTGTALPGAEGNLALAGHRAGHGSPFLDFEDLRPGDEVRVAQGRTTWVYELTSDPVVIDTDDRWVLDPLPGRALTLTTCWPKYGSLRRMYVRGALVDVRVS